MVPDLEERKFRYIESIKEEYRPSEKDWWQHPPPIYHFTKDLAGSTQHKINTNEPVVFKKTRKEWRIAAVMVVVASLLIYYIGKKEFGWMQTLLLILLLLIVVPLLQENKGSLRISREGLWLYKEEKEIRWEDLLLTYIKEVREETSSYFFIAHFFDPATDDFCQTEINLEKLVSPSVLSATIEAFRPA